jgi:hypothetical protein
MPTKADKYGKYYWGVQPRLGAEIMCYADEVRVVRWNAHPLAS